MICDAGDEKNIKQNVSEQDNSESEEANCSSILPHRLGQCEVCAANAARYTCPKCEVKTCCLRCVQIHKKELNCDGIRDRTKFIPLRKMTKMDFMSDYYFLEECTRYVEDRKHDRIKRLTFQNKDLPKRLFQLRKAAFQRKTKVHFLMPHFSRHKENMSHFNWKLRKIFWHIEWIFVNACNAKYVDNGCDEEKPLHVLLDKYFNPLNDENVPRKSLLNYYQSAGVFNVKILLKAECVKRSQSRFYLLDAAKSIKENLKSKVIIEYPSIHLIYDNNLDAYDVIDSDEDIEGETKSYQETLEKLRKELKEAERLKRKLTDNEHETNEEDKEKLEKLLAENQLRSRKRKLEKFEKEPTNYLFTDDNLVDALSTSESENEKETK